MQYTVKSPVTFKGVGLHSGAPVRMTIHPASAEYGIWFRRSDVTRQDNLIAARWDSVNPARLCTRIENADGVSVSTVEHIMAALAGLGIHNALIEISNAEVPILDGSAAPFVRGILARGMLQQHAPVRVLRILEPVEVREGDAVARLDPAQGFEMRFEIDFADTAIGRQVKHLDLSNGAFVRQLCDSRTFCRSADVDFMRANGMALGGTMENAVVVDGDRVLTPGGLRHSDEPVRHKMLDALGDLYLAGAPILGRYTGRRAGHALTASLLHAVFSRPGAACLTVVDSRVAARLPGVGVRQEDLALCA
ncbi:MAG: UDP-3-O-acyl-N-acetylglucosamine deacetylase [Rhodobacteraceae bacterium]|nr:UDP-3-O-acyl-N-acetylglucosamine deacetylase [Paracoccaceae bacterium]